MRQDIGLRMRRLLLALLLAAITAAPAAARMLGDPSVPFSADRSLSVGDRTFSGKIYAKPGSQRHEQAIAGIDQVIILHGSDAKGWLVLPKLNSYVEFWFAPAAAELSADDLLSTKLGEETVAGLRTGKYRIEHVARDGTLVDGYVWLTREASRCGSTAPTRRRTAASPRRSTWNSPTFGKGLRTPRSSPSRKT